MSLKKNRSCNFLESEDDNEPVLHTSLIYNHSRYKKKVKKQFVANRAQVISQQIKGIHFSVLASKPLLTFLFLL